MIQIDMSRKGSGRRSGWLVRLLVLLVAGLWVQVSAVAQNNRTAEDHYSRARRLIEAGQYDEAISAFQRAERADPGYWRYPYMFGEFLIKKMEQWDLALQAYHRAWDNGYRHGITRHKMGVCEYHFERYPEAFANFERAITMNNTTLSTAAEKDRGLLSYQTADSFVWKTKIYDLERDYARIFDAAVEGIHYNPGNQWLPGLYARSALQLGHTAFGNGEYDKAIEYYRLSLIDPVTGDSLDMDEWDDFPDWRIPTDTLIEVVEHRKRLGQIRPQYTHHILALYIADQDVVTEVNGETRRIHKTLNDVQIREGTRRLRWLRQVVESLSDGNLSISFAEEVDTTTYRYSGETRPGWVGDRRVIYDHVGAYDTIIRCWAYGEGTGTGGAGRLDIIPYVIFGPERGMVSVHPEHSHGLWLHEFFHEIERMANIGPTHGYYDEPRVNFPGWRGRKNNQLDYFRWHFRTTLPTVGWSEMNFHEKSPARLISKADFEHLSRVYAGISLEDRIQADKLVEEVDSLQRVDIAGAVRKYESALQLSPYYPDALAAMAAYHRSRLDVRAAKPLVEKLAVTKAPDEKASILLDFQAQYDEIAPMGVPVGEWHPKDLANGPAEITWDVSSMIRGPGTYEITFWYTRGWKAVDISWASLSEGTREISKNTHDGFSGNRKENNMYTLVLGDYRHGSRYSIRALLEGSGGTDSNGVVLMRKAD